MKECSILWCGKYQQKWENAIHAHNYFQLVVILNGCGEIVFGDARQPIARDRLYLFRPQQPHAIYGNPADPTPLRMLDVKFEVADPALSDDLYRIECPLSLENHRWFTGSFERIIHESLQKEKYYAGMINVTLYAMLVRLVRETICGHSDPAVEEGLEEPPVKEQRGIHFEPLMQYIHMHYSSIISLDDLAGFAKVSKTILIDAFKTAYGITPIAYINQLRLQKARELLVNTNANIGEIARLVGFQSIYYFSRTFKAKENCTPMAYRQQHADSQYYSF